MSTTAAPDANATPSNYNKNNSVRKENDIFFSFRNGIFELRDHCSYVLSQCTRALLFLFDQSSKITSNISSE